jgi:hypothetical protein
MLEARLQRYAYFCFPSSYELSIIDYKKSEALDIKKTNI